MLLIQSYVQIASYLLNNVKQKEAELSIAKPGVFSHRKTHHPGLVGVETFHHSRIINPGLVGTLIFLPVQEKFKFNSGLGGSLSFLPV